MTSASLRGVGLFGAIAIACGSFVGCAEVLGLGDFHEDGAGGSSGTLATSTGSQSTSATMSATGTGGSPGCMMGDVEVCYEGPQETTMIGNCRSGNKTCDANGMFGACVGQVLPMTEVCTTEGDEDRDGYGCSDPLWIIAADSTAARATANAAVDRTTGDVIVTSTFSAGLTLASAMEVSAGGSDGEIARLSPAGTVLWSHRYGNGGDQAFGKVKVDAMGNIYALITSDGFFQMDNVSVSPGASLMKFASNGMAQWAVSCGPTGGADLFNLSVGTEGITVTGAVNGTGTVICGSTQLPGNLPPGFILRVNPDGSVAWQKRFQNVGSAMTTDVNGSILLTGSFNGTITFGGPALTAPGAGIGGVLFYAKLDSMGNHLWSNQQGDKGLNVGGRAIATDGLGNVYIQGAFINTLSFGILTTPLMSDGGADMFVVALDGNGGFTWSRRLGDAAAALEPQFSLFGDMAIAGNDLVIASRGHYMLDGNDYPNPAVVKLATADGKTTWVRPISAQDLHGVSVGPDREVVAAGNFGGTVNVGSKSATCTACQTTLDFAGYITRIGP